MLTAVGETNFAGTGAMGVPGPVWGVTDVPEQSVLPAWRVLGLVTSGEVSGGVPEVAIRERDGLECIQSPGLITYRA